jgi:signal transduction histidine kinase/ActR/RegA family two-component response regulator
MLKDMAERNRDVTSVFMLDASGQSFISSRRFPMPSVDGSDRDYFRHLRENDALYVSAPGRGRVDHDRFFILAKRRSSADGRFDGLIAVSVDPAYFEAFYATLRESPRGTIGLVRADGTMLVREPALPDAGIVLPPSSEFMSLLARQPDAGVLTAPSVADGVERVYAYRRVGDYPVYASFNTPMALVWARWRASTLPYALATLLAMGMLLVGVAFAEQRTRRAAAEARSREAEQASRAKDLFVAALSHELRNPLAAIAAAGEILQRNPGSQAPIQIIARQIAQLRRMLDDLLDTARAVYGKLKLEQRRVNLRELAEAALAEHLARCGAQGAVRADGGEAWVEGDPVRLRQLLDNLVDNAIKYGARRVEVAIECRDDRVELVVRDDGEGIAAELLPRLFTPFVQGEQTLDRARGGLGLGLALANRIASLHRGTLSAESEGPGRGSSFTLSLPRAEAVARAVVRSGALHERKWRLLIIDDEADARESLGALLRFEGHEVDAAADGPSGLAAIAAAAPEVALVDIGLPGLDGYEVARRARALSRDTALVAITGYGQAQDRERARGAGFDAHLTKPFSYEDLMDELSRLKGRDRGGPESEARSAGACA